MIFVDLFYEYNIITMFKVNLKTLSQMCEKNNKLLNICKGHNQILCKLALENAGYTKDLDKWKGRYCFLVKHLIDVTLKAKSKVSLQQKDKLLKVISERRLDIPKTVIKFIEKNNSSVQKGKGPEEKSIFDKYLEEIDTLIDKHKQKENLQKIDDLLKDLNDQNTLQIKINELNRALVSADSYVRPQILKHRNVLQKRLNEIESAYPSPSPVSSDSSFNPLKGRASPDAYTPVSDTSSNISNIFKTKKFVPRILAGQMMTSPKQSSTIFSTDFSEDTESYFSEDQSVSYTLREISEELPDVLKSYFTGARLQGKYKLPENIVTLAQSNYRARNSEELSVFDGNFVEVDTIYSNGKVLGKIIDTDNIVNVTDMYRYGTFPITVFLPKRK